MSGFWIRSLAIFKKKYFFQYLLDLCLLSQNVGNGGNIMVMLALRTNNNNDDGEEGSSMEVEDRVHETRKLAETLAKRVDGKNRLILTSL